MPDKDPVEKSSTPPAIRQLGQAFENDVAQQLLRLAERL